MAARSTPRKKQEQTIAVKVVATPPRPPLEPSIVKPVAKSPKIEKPKSETREPLPLAQRQRIMWWTVGVGATIIVGVWLFTVRYELQTKNSSGNLFSDIIHSIRNINLGQTAKPSPKQEEIQKYEQQVFPQFSK